MDDPHDTPERTRRCLNCDTELTGRYCATCGQEDHSLSVPLHRLVLDFLSDQFQFDARVWRTLHLLIFRPGWLTHEYLLGRRQRHIPPVRLYLFVSIVFFLVAGLLPSHASLNGVTPATGSYKASPAATPARVTSAASATSVGRAIAHAFSAASSGQAGVTANHGALERWLETHVKAAAADPQGFSHRFRTNLPKVLFFLIPVFALLLKLLYLLKRRYYSEHLIFALHYHSVIFLLLLLIVLLLLGARASPPALATGVRWLCVALGIWAGIYLFPALHTAYSDTWPRALWRGTVLAFLYAIALGLGTLGAALVTLAMTGAG